MGEEWDFILLPSRGNSGGIMVIWRTNVASFSLIKSLDQCFLGELEIFNKNKWMIATTYGNREYQGRRDLWNYFDGVVEQETPAVFGSDFDCIISQDEKNGGMKFSFSLGPLEMKVFMNNNDLHDIGIIGAKFTWCNNKSGSARIVERLDRCMMNSKALELQQVHKSRFRKFEDVWISYAAATSVIKNSWAKLDNLRKEIENLQQEEASDLLFPDNKALILRTKVKEFNSTLARLNTWWKQRAKSKWMKEGDVNTSFIHAFTNGRRNRNTIKKLRKEEGELVEDQYCLRRNFFQFFCKKWKYKDCILEYWPMNENILKHEECEILDSEVKLEEVE
ncbi:uncharacterized protein LOC110114704 [Dendrobium catenatum]|uniref:uncharacterized protein LOC110114704 n=1 Tax=Dendrobium catenatum TaxID=906689 RepID=UPI0009F59B14|nr:uncharacterized protein LOC110114704 [Dendrobium catenatum]